MRTPPESIEERNASVIRRMLPGSTGGRSRLVAPERKSKQATIQPPGFEGPLPPWGYAGDEGSYNGWHSVHVTADDALAGDAPYLTFGLAPDEDNGVGYGARLNETDSFVIVVEDDFFAFEGQKNSGSDDLKASLFLRGDSNTVRWLLEGPETQRHEVFLSDTQAYSDLSTAAGNQALVAVQDDGNTYLKLFAASSGAAWIEMNEGAAPATPGANKARIFLRDNGSGKTQFCIEYATGGVRVLDTQP